MAIQHRDIENNERHEIKGAELALAGTVPVATGSGSTQFQRIGVSQMSGSIPTGVPNLTLVTDGAGGFQAKSNIYARFLVSMSGSMVNPTFQTILTNGGNGFTVDGSAFIFSETGEYWYSVEGAGYREPGENSPPSVIWNNIVNEAAPTIPVTAGISGIMAFAAGTRYRLNGSGAVSIWKLS